MPDILTALLDTATRHPAAPAITGSDGQTLTYGEFRRRVLATARGLRAAGLVPGERVLFSVRPGPAGVVLAFGIVAAGAVVVFGDPGAAPELFAARFALAEPRWAAAEALLYAAALPGVRRVARRRGLLLPAYADLPVRHLYAGRRLPGVPRKALSARRLTTGPSIEDVHAAPDDDAVVVFTSGTTAAPRAVVHTRGSLGAALDTLAGACALKPGHTVHTDQLMLGLPALVSGAHWTMPRYGFSPAADPASFARGLAGASHAFCVPADLAALLDSVEQGRVAPPGVGTLLVGGAPVLPPLLRRAASVLPATTVLAVYGMTEILPISVATGAEKLAHRGDGDLVGAALPGLRARLDDLGRLVVAGPNLARGYLGAPPLTELVTGDLARLDEAGRIVLLGRATDMIIRGTVNIYPGLWEPALAALPGVAAAALIGVPDSIGDEWVVLAVVPDGPPGPTAPLPDHPLAATVTAAATRILDAGAQPDAVIVLGAFPTAGRSHKLDRPALRALVATQVPNGPEPAAQVRQRGRRRAGSGETRLG
jgi:acyl-CoA synthetase (AMP-forming)/AMP-acid ligase II